MSRKDMEIVVNGERRRVPPTMSVAGLLEILGVAPGTVVVELNREILSRDRGDDVQLSAGDRVEIVHFVGGG